jgi:bacteriocin-like protein
VTKDNEKSAAPEHLVKSFSAAASIALSETELAQVTGGDEKKTTPKKPADKQEYLTITMSDALIS